MPNSLTSWTAFAPLTKIESAKMNTNLTALKNQSPLFQKYTIPYTTFSAMGAVASGTTTAFALASNEVIHGFIVKHSTLFTGGAISGASIKIGIAGTTDKYTDEFDVHQAVAASAKLQTEILAFEAALTNVLVTCSLTGGNLSALSQGSIDIYVQKCELP
jgi:hypothetical protein